MRIELVFSVGPNAGPRLRSTGEEEARRGRGWVPASARTTDGEGMDSRPRLYGGRLFAGITGVGAGMMGWGFCGAGAVAGGRPQGSPLRRRGREDKANLLWAQNRIGLGEAKNENENRIGLSVRPNAGPRLWSMGGEVGEGDGSPHPRGQRMGKGWIPAPVFIGAGSSRE